MDAVRQGGDAGRQGGDAGRQGGDAGRPNESTDIQLDFSYFKVKRLNVFAKTKASNTCLSKSVTTPQSQPAMPQAKTGPGGRI